MVSNELYRNAWDDFEDEGSKPAEDAPPADGEANADAPPTAADAEPVDEWVRRP